MSTVTRKTFLQSLAAPLVSATRKRNLVLILSDDHRFDMMSCQGHPWIKTPHMDRLAGGGVLFENAFVTTSLCSPSRASILTGQYVHAHGVTDNRTLLPPQLATFPQVLQQHGYRTAFFGKWHMGGSSDAPRPGFDRWFSFRGQGSYVDPEINDDGRRRQRRGYLTDILTNEATQFIEENRSQPFLLYLSHKAVHGHFIPAERHQDWYSEAAIPYPKSMADTEENYRGKPDWLRRQRGSWHGVEVMYNHRAGFDDVYRGCARTLMSLDDSIGQVYDTLDEAGLLDDTLLLYMGDNGFMFGDHGLIDKRAMPAMRPGHRYHPPCTGGRCSKCWRAMQTGVPISSTSTSGSGPIRRLRRWSAFARIATVSCATTASGISTSCTTTNRTPTR
ncbi:MAG: sulfatase-like hydrolase/transferase [bacterium]|nr:sulfatase-like hydrolase/transferase [bacterium]